MTFRAFIACATIAGFWASASEAATAEVRGIAPVLNRVTVLRGGVLLLQLKAETPGSGWPSTVVLRFEDGQEIAAEVAWVHARASTRQRRWTDDASGLAVRPIRPTDDSGASADGGFPIALAAMPPDRTGDFTIIDPRPGRGIPSDPVRPTWVERELLAASWNPLAIAAGATEPRAVLERRSDLALPDPDSPFEYFRWVLMAHAMELEPPPPPGEGVEALLATHGAQMWSIGLSRLAAQSPAVAATCAEVLTATVLDGGLRVGAWVTDPVEINALLAILLDATKRDRAVMDAALAWAESRAPVVIWPVDEHGTGVTISAMNTLRRAVELRGVWAGAEQQPIVRTIPGGELGSVLFPRPAALAREGIQQRDPRRSPLSLLLRVEGSARTFPVGPAVVDAAPPGVPLPTFRPSLRLFEVRSGVQEMIPVEQATAGILRRSRGRWELFVECGRPVSGAEGGEAKGPLAPVGQDDPPLDLQLSPPLAVMRSNGVPIGREAILLTIGPRDRPLATLAVPEDGEPWLIGPGRGAERLPRDDGAEPPAPTTALRSVAPPAELEVHRRSLPGVWRCRIVLPESWLPRPPDDGAPRPPLLIGVARTHDGQPTIEISGLPQVPWRPWPAPMAVDLDRWDR